MVSGSLRIFCFFLTAKVGPHDIAAILMKVALSKNNQSINQSMYTVEHVYSLTFLYNIHLNIIIVHCLSSLTSTIQSH